MRTDVKESSTNWYYSHSASCMSQTLNMAQRTTLSVRPSSLYDVTFRIARITGVAASAGLLRMSWSRSIMGKPCSMG